MDETLPKCDDTGTKNTEVKPCNGDNAIEIKPEGQLDVNHNSDNIVSIDNASSDSSSFLDELSDGDKSMQDLITETVGEMVNVVVEEKQSIVEETKTIDKPKENVEPSELTALNDNFNTDETEDENKLVIVEDKMANENEEQMQPVQHESENMPQAPKLKITIRSSPSGKRLTSFRITDELLLPFKCGWRRELVMRTSCSESAFKKRQGDVYYYTPDNIKLRSMPKIMSYLSQNPTMKFDQTNFSFAKQKVYKEPEEIIRDAKASSVFRTPTLKPTTPSPVMVSVEPLPSKRKIKPINRDYPGEVLIAKDNRPKKREPVTITECSPPNKKLCIKPIGGITSPNIVSKLNMKTYSAAQSAEPEPVNAIIAFSQPEPKVEDSQPLCSMKCPGRNNEVPSLLCCVCLCLFHPRCVKFDAAVSESLICPRCFQGIKEGRTKAPIGAKKALMSLLFPECAKNIPDSSNKENNGSKHPELTQFLSSGDATNGVDSSVYIANPFTTQNKLILPKATAPLASLTPISCTLSSSSTCIPGTLIFTNAIKNSQTSSTPSANNQPPGGATPVILKSPTQTFSPPIATKGIQPSLATNGKYFLHMIPEPSGEIRYVLSPSQTTVRTPASTSSPVNTLAGSGAQTCVVRSPNFSLPKSINSNEFTITPIARDAIPKKILPKPHVSKSSPVANTPVVDSERVRKSRRLECHFNMLHSGYTSMMTIFRYLPITDLLRCGQVCKTWQSIVNQSSLWKSVAFKNLLVTNWQTCIQFLTKRSINSLNLIDMKWEDEQRMWRDFLSTLRNLGNLKQLHFGRVPSSVLLAISDQLYSLEVLAATNLMDYTSAGSNNVCYLDIGKLQRLLSLKELSLHGITGLSIPKFSFAGGFQSLGSLKNITTLSITSFKDLSCEDIHFLNKLTNLKALEIGECTHFDSEAYGVIGSLVQLDKLRLELVDVKSSADLAACISKLVSLKELGLILTRITQEVAEAFSLLSELEKLTVWPPNHEREHSYTNIHRMLAMMTSLKKLQWGIVVDDAELTSSKDKVKSEEASNINNVSIRIPFVEGKDKLVKKFVDTKTLLHSLRAALPSTIVNIMFAPSPVAYQVSRLSSL